MGHLFIVRGDLRRLACDAWLLPTDSVGAVTADWIDEPNVRAMLTDGRLRRPTGSGSKTRAYKLPGPGTPSIWATEVGGDVRSDISWYLDAADQFFETACATLTKRPAAFGRSTHLLALPLIGTGKGGADSRKGGMADSLVRHLAKLANRSPVDIALVLHDEKALAAAQAVRWRMFEADKSDPWSELNNDLAGAAQRLSAFAANGRLVVFFGAGPSVAAGLPGWEALLDELAKLANLGPIQLEDLKDLDLRDRARVIELALKPEGLRKELEALLAPSRRSLLHLLLANLPVSEFVTTNFDTIFEAAWREAGADFSELPYEPRPTNRWLLKLHGSLPRGDIVLTRSDYLGLQQDRAALAGIVQALLITRHMLFVGYGLRDDDFHSIVHDVRKAIGPRDAASDPFATALLPERARFLRQLWEPDIDVISIGDSSNTEVAAAARLQDILLDRVLAESLRSRAAYVLDDAYASLLTNPEKDLADRLRGLAEAAGDGSSQAHRAVRRFLAELGFSKVP